MLIGNANDKFKTKITHDVCDHHKKHPGDRWPGCTCFSSYERKRVIKADKIIDFVRERM